jgi:hypothetical protein
MYTGSGAGRPESPFCGLVPINPQIGEKPQHIAIAEGKEPYI